VCLTDSFTLLTAFVCLLLAPCHRSCLVASLGPLSLQTYQVSRISRETPAFWSHLPLTRRITKISRISCTKFGQLSLSKMVKIVATRCHILRLKCPKFDFGWGSAPDPTGGSQIQYSPRPPSWILWVLLIKGKGERGQGLAREGKGKEKGTGGRTVKAGGKGEPREGKERREGEWRG